MALNAFGLGFLFSAKDNASRVMQGVDRNFQQMDRSTNRAAQRMQAAQGAMAVGMGAMAVGAAGLAVTMKSALAAGDFEQGVAKVGAISGATSQELEQLSKKAIQAGIDTQFSPKEAIDGLGELAVRGLTAKESMGALDGALNLAAGGQISIAEASSTTASALKVFGLEADQAGLAADKLLKISNVTALQAKDLELALGTVGRGAGLAKQSIDEMLPSIGLVKNTGVDASVAASSVSSGLLFMAKNAKKFDEMGVKVTDANGKFRPFMDIVLDTQQAMSGLDSEAEKTAKAMELFGRFGVVSFNAIATQTEKGIRKPTGEIVKGAEAVAFLRESMQGAAGTAQKFADALLDTLPGQITLLKGSIQTLGITLGQPIAEALRPAVEFVKESINTLIGVIQGMSPGMRKAVGLILVVVSALTSLAGVALFVGAAIAIAAPGIAALGAALAGAAGSIAVASAALAGFMALTAVLRKAWDENIGGLADRLRPIFGKVKLLFDALGQYMREGFFSGDVAKKLQDPNNVGVFSFLSALIRMGFRVGRFFEGIRDGFNTFMVVAGPAFEMFGEGVRRISDAFGLLAEDANAAIGRSEVFAKVGNFIGTVFGKAAELVIAIIGRLAIVYAGFVKGFRAGMKIMAPLINGVVDAFYSLGEVVATLFEEMGLLGEVSNENADIWDGIGQVLGFVRSAVLMPMLVTIRNLISMVKFWVNVVVAGVRLIKSTFGGLIDIAHGILKFFMGDWKEGWKLIVGGLKGMFQGLLDFFVDIFDAIAVRINDMLDLLADVAAQLPASVRPAFLDSFIAQRGLRKTQEVGSQMEAELEAKSLEEDRYRSLAARPVIPYANNIAGAAEAQAKQAPTQGTGSDAVKQGMLEALRELDGSRPQQKKVTQIVMDGEVLAQKTEAQRADTAARSFGADVGGDD